MTPPKREIYSIGYNRSFTDEGVLKIYSYTLGVPSHNEMKIPESIKEDGDYIVVTFTDKSRHRLPLSGGVEILDRIVEPKDKQNGKRISM